MNDDERKRICFLFDDGIVRVCFIRQNGSNERKRERETGRARHRDPSPSSLASLEIHLTSVLQQLKLSSDSFSRSRFGLAEDHSVARVLFFCFLLPPSLDRPLKLEFAHRWRSSDFTSYDANLIENYSTSDHHCRWHIILKDSLVPNKHVTYTEASSEEGHHMC